MARPHTDRFALVHSVFHAMGQHTTTTLIVLGVLYALFHGHHYRRRRREGLSIWASIPGPFGTRISRRF